MTHGNELLHQSQNTVIFSDCSHITYAAMTWYSIGTAGCRGHPGISSILDKHRDLLKGSWTFLIIWLGFFLHWAKSITHIVFHVDTFTVWLQTNLQRSYS